MKAKDATLQLGSATNETNGDGYAEEDEIDSRCRNFESRRKSIVWEKILL